MSWMARFRHALAELGPDPLVVPVGDIFLGSHWKYMRRTVSVRWLTRAKPCSELA
jgi:hypothetical protein